MTPRELDALAWRLARVVAEAIRETTEATVVDLREPEKPLVGRPA